MNEKQNYFETLAAAVDEVAERAAAQCVLARPSEVLTLGQDHLGYGQTRRGDFEILTIKERKTWRWFHAVVCRLDSGRYELTTYIL